MFSRISNLKINKGYVFLFFFILWFAFNLFCSLNHVHWRDEGQAWMISKVICFDNFKNILSGEGHGILWFLVLKPFSVFDFPYEYISLISLFIMSLSAGVLYLTRLNLFAKILLLFSPVFNFYNPVIARNYSLCILELVLLLYFYEKKEKNPVIIGVILFLMLQTHIYLAPLAVMFTLLLFKDYFNSRSKNYLKGALISTFGIIVTILTLNGNASVLEKFITNPIELFNHMYYSIGKILIFAQGAIITYGNDFIDYMFNFLFITFLIPAIKNYKRCYFEIIVFVFSILGILLILYSYSMGHIQHKILFFAILIFLMRLINNKISPDGEEFFIKLSNISLYIILLISIQTAFNSAIEDKNKVYSNSKVMTEYILENHKNDLIVITNDEDFFPNIAAYLRKNNNLISGYNGREYTYFDRMENKSIPFNEFVENPDKNYYYIFKNSQLNDKLELIHKEDNDSVWMENFYLYKRKKI